MDTRRLVVRIAVKIIVITSLAARVVFAGPIEDCQEYSKYGVPSKDGDILCRKGYLLSHNPNTKTPVWVIEHLTKEKANGDLARTNDFRADPDLTQGIAALPGA
nr:DNA/RNA non-specific endonuclease [Geotalea sp. SG265]